MIDRFVVSKSQGLRIPCDGPLPAQVERVRLEESMKAAGKPLDVEIEFPKRKRPRAHGSVGRSTSHK
jgi:hypothetical protein